ncbi:MAG: hypothetical protein IJP98_02340 [Clostridia bacterium]|nr:hypothetical protein [Clostridia bacterium]
MAYRVKQRIFAGAVCEQEVYSVTSNRKRTAKDSVPRIRFQSEEEYEQHKAGISRRHFVQLVNANFSPTSLYSTLTFDQENEVHTFEEAQQLRDRYWRRLKRMYPDAVICIVVGRGKSTKRIHLHMLSEGVDVAALLDEWTYGDIVDVQHLREHNYYNGIDYGADYTALANYLWNHWTPEQGGHRYKITKNARKPEKERPTEPVTAYSLEHPPRPPRGYAYVEGFSTEYGYLHFKYVKIPEKDPKRGSRGDLLGNPCKYVKFWNQEGQEGTIIKQDSPSASRRRLS